MHVCVLCTSHLLILAGVLRGAGKQYVGAAANVFAYYAVGLPMAYLICFRLHHGVDGLMMGIATGSLVQVLALFTMIFCFEKYLYSGAVVRKEAGFAPLAMDESVHNSNSSSNNSSSADDGIELGKPRRGGDRDDARDTGGKSVYSTLHYSSTSTSTSQVSVDVTVDESSSEGEHQGNDYSL